jgi:colanic acid biosynthesis protein WcaH
MHNQSKLDDVTFSHLIQIAPLVAIDLIVRDDSGRVLLALRNHQPAKNYYFVPGGRIFKNERIRDAYERILLQETGIEGAYDEARLLGAYDHIYASNRYEQEGYGTHYVVLAHLLELAANVGSIRLDDYHASHLWLSEAELKMRADVHPFVKVYFAS